MGLAFGMEKEEREEGRMGGKEAERGKQTNRSRMEREMGDEAWFVPFSTHSFIHFSFNSYYLSKALCWTLLGI